MHLQGVTKLLFVECSVSSPTIVSPGIVWILNCPISGVDADDFALATLRNMNSVCYDLVRATPSDSGNVAVWVRNECPYTAGVGDGTIAITVFDK